MTLFGLSSVSHLQATALRLEESSPRRICTDSIRAAVENIKPPRLLFDLSLVEFINEDCLQDLIQLGTQLRSKGGVLVLLNCRPAVCDVLDPLPRRQNLHPESCPMFIAENQSDAIQWLR